VALCQEATLHYLNGKNGVKDFDVWSFYTKNPVRMFPPRRVAKVAFGDPKFGVSPDAHHFLGRRVDLIGQSIPAADPTDPTVTPRLCLKTAATESAYLLAKIAIILIEPMELLGIVVWPPP
jgi:hypothetical protein